MKKVFSTIKSFLKETDILCDYLRIWIVNGLQCHPIHS